MALALEALEVGSANSWRRLRLQSAAGALVADLGTIAAAIIIVAIRWIAAVKTITDFADQESTINYPIAFNWGATGLYPP